MKPRDPELIRKNVLSHCVINVSVPLLSGQPRTLQDLCRIKIRHCIGLQSLKFLEDLPIAKVMKDYLKHKFDNV